MHEQIGRFVPRVQLAVRQPAGEQDVVCEPQLGDSSASSCPRNGPAPTITQRQRPCASRPECSRSAASAWAST